MSTTTLTSQLSQPRAVERLVAGQATSDGAGVKLTRVLTNTLQRLEGRGLISVTGDPTDARRKKVSITEDGYKAYNACVAALRPMMESMREAFTQDEFQDALPFLNALRVWLVETRNEIRSARPEPEPEPEPGLDPSAKATEIWR